MSWDLLVNGPMALSMAALGLPIYENAYLTEPEPFEVEVKLTDRQRWIEPLLHPATVPFEPWVKTRIESGTRQVPSRKIIKTPQGLFMHPMMAAELRRAMVAEQEKRVRRCYPH